MDDPRCDDGLPVEAQDCRVEAWLTVQHSRTRTWTTAPAAQYSKHGPRSESIGWEIPEPGDKLVLNKFAPNCVPDRAVRDPWAIAHHFRVSNPGADSLRNWRPHARHNPHTAQSTTPPQFPRGIAFRQRLQIVKSETWHFDRDFDVDGQPVLADRQSTQYRSPSLAGSIGPAKTFRTIAFFNLGCHGLTVFGMAVRMCQRHGRGEYAKTVPPDSHFEKGDRPVKTLRFDAVASRVPRGEQSCSS